MILAVVQSSIILLIVLIAVFSMRRQSAAVRHGVLAVGLLCSLAAPLIDRLLPDVEFAADGLYARVEHQTKLLWNPDSNYSTASLVTPSTLMAHAPDARAIPSVIWIWLAGSGIAAGIILAGIVRIVWLVIRSESLHDPRWVVAAHEVSCGLALNREVQLLRSSGRVLGTLGLMRPKVFLPLDAIDWSDERMRIVLTHELAHIKRFDWPVQFLAELGRAVYWFNPLFWVACRRLRSSSEQACDDVVLGAGFDAREYAAHLLELARARKTSSRAWSAVMAMSRPPDLERRFIAMLNPSLNRRSLTRAAFLAICAIAVCVTLPVAAMRAPEKLKPRLEERARPMTATAIARVAAPESSPSQPGAPALKREPSRVELVPPQGLIDLAGTVTDPTGALVPGVRLTVVSPVRPVFAEAMTDEAGRYEFRVLESGPYLLTAVLPGFASTSRRVEIKSGQTTRQNIALAIGSVAQTVTVSAVGSPAPPPAPAAGPQRIRVGGVVVAARLISQVKPVYPQAARDAGIVGSVNLQGIIGVDGTLIGLRVLSGSPLLTEAAMEAVRQWRYQPTLLNGTPAEVITEITVEFELVR